MTEGGDADKGGPRTFLFLQGPSSPIFLRLAQRLEERGHTCLRINLCTGDWLFWRRRGAVNFRGSLRAWPGFVGAFMEKHGVTDLLFLGEERDYHGAAARLAKRRGIRVFALDMGYLRPDWIRIERGGSGHNSHFPTEPQQILDAARDLPKIDHTQKYFQTFVADAAYDLLFNLPNVFLWFLYPGYHWHAIFHPLDEYRGWVMRLLRSKRRTRHAVETVARVVRSAEPVFIFPLQLETDFQIRAYSPFDSQTQAIGLVIRSFAANAADDARLIVKVHPLDNGLIDWRGEVESAARRFGVAERVELIDGGNLSLLLDRASGVVTINSTVGIQAIQHGTPVVVLGTAIYAIRGLTHGATLDEFWRSPRPSDPVLADAFLRLIAVALHVRGNFYSRTGIEAGAAALAQRLHEQTVNEPGAFLERPILRNRWKRKSYKFES
jgi:capsular polysaccharide export protein